MPGSVPLVAIVLFALAAAPLVAALPYDGPPFPTLFVHPANPLEPRPPDDPLWGLQYGLAQVHAMDAWRHEQGRRGVLVAVVDTGIDRAHPELAAACVRCAPGSEDRHGHGTHVAGVVAAQANNALGVAGLAPGVGLIAIKAFDDAGQATWEQVSAAVVAAADAGADVISMSWGGDCSFLHKCAVLDGAIKYAHGKGAVLVAAAGNRGCEPCVARPAAYPEVIAVSATDAAGRVAAFSSRGPEVDLSAPGDAVLSTVPFPSYSTLTCSVQGEEPSPYCRKTGTSMATPHVSAAAALLLSHCPSLDAGEVRAILEASARDLGPRGADPGYGHGVLDAGRALSAVACHVETVPVVTVLR